jgi:hypothetical protein
MAFSTDITLSGSFVNLNSVSGLATNLNFIIQNKTSKDIVLIASNILKQGFKDISSESLDYERGDFMSEFNFVEGRNE